MMGVLAYVGAEAMTGKPVVELTPIFFKPIWVVVMGMMGMGSADANVVAVTVAATAPIAEVAKPVVETVAAAPAAEVVAPAAETPVVAQYVAEVYDDLKKVVPETPATEYIGAV